MKEAAGEANITVITIVLIAIVLAIGTPLVRSVLNSTAKSSCCQGIGGYWRGGRCRKEESGDNYWDESYYFNSTTNECVGQ